MYKVNTEIAALDFKGLQIKKILISDTLDILAISLEKGTLFPEHTSPRNAHLMVLEGAIEFAIDQKKFKLGKQEYFYFPKAVKHEVRALQDSKFLIVR